MPCRNPCRLSIHLAFTYYVGLASIVWRELGPAPMFPPTRVLEVYWLEALSLVCEVALRVREAERFMGVRVTHQDGVQSVNFLEWRSTVATERDRLISTWWFNWKKELRLPATTFSISDWNLSPMKIDMGPSNIWHNLLSLETSIVDHYPNFGGKSIIRGVVVSMLASSTIHISNGKHPWGGGNIVSSPTDGKNSTL